MKTPYNKFALRSLQGLKREITTARDVLKASVDGEEEARPKGRSGASHKGDIQTAREILQYAKTQKTKEAIRTRQETANAQRRADPEQGHTANASPKEQVRIKKQQAAVREKQETDTASKQRQGTTQQAERQGDRQPNTASAQSRHYSSEHHTATQSQMSSEAKKQAGKAAAKKAAEKSTSSAASSSAQASVAGATATGSATSGAAAGTAATGTAASGGWVVIVVVAVIAIVILFYLMSSIVGELSKAYLDEMGSLQYLNTQIIRDIQDRALDEWLRELQATKQACVDDGIERINVHTRYNWLPDVDNDGVSSLSNWNDVWAIWLIRNDRMISEGDYEEVKSIYFAMNPITVTTTEVEIPAEIEGEEARIERHAYIDVRNLNYEDMADEYGLGAAQLQQIDAWLNQTSEDSALWYKILGAPVRAGDDYNSYYTTLPPGEEVTNVLLEAARREGWIYSNSRRMQSGYDDCSSFVWGCYQLAGIDFGDSSWAPTAAAQAKWCDDRNCRVAEEDLQPGDLIFWSGKDNGRYLDIYHVAIYVGGGKMWESCPSAGGVIFRSVSKQNPSNILFYARPTAAITE